VRIIAGLAAFWYCDEWKLFFWCYWVSYFLDCFDGAAARKFNQATRFGQMLDMVLAPPLAAEEAVLLICRFLCPHLTPAGGL